MTLVMTIDEKYQDLAERAKGQCAELLEAFERIDFPEDESVAPERLAGIRMEKEGKRSSIGLIFQSEETPRQRTVVYVDAILDLADLLRRERLWTDVP